MTNKIYLLRGFRLHRFSNVSLSMARSISTAGLQMPRHSN